MEIPVLSNIVEGLGVFFKTRRYVAYLIVFVSMTFIGLFFSIIIAGSVGTGLETILTTTFVYVGATGAIYFGLGTLFTGVGLDKLWITRRGRGRVTELKGAAWMAVSFALSVVLGVGLGRDALYFFAIFGWLGWIAFQAFLSSRTSLTLASIAEPKKGSIAIGIGSFFILIIGLGIIALEALAALILIPSDFMGIGTAVVGMFPEALTNLSNQQLPLLIAYALMGLFALVSLFAFFKYARKGAALNIALLVLFIGVYSGYFLVNVLRRSGAPSIEVADILMSLFFLVYALAGIGSTLTESVEGSRSRLRDFGPLATFFLASSFFFVDSIITLSTTAPSVGVWFGGWVATEEAQLATWVFRDSSKLIAFPLAAIASMLYYLRTGRLERIVERAREDGDTYDPDEVDDDIADATPDPGESWASERSEGVKKGDQGHDLSAPDPDRMSVDSSRRLGAPKRLGDDEEDED
ncbi:MAG: hypothetical protein KAQ65_01260 [Candidatus Thorarchaeota archaeon]|nr:hypothetical protein [Candidatus Thorarchaeota archaeon]